MCWLLVTANVVPSSPILVTLMMEALRSSDTSVLTRATQFNIPGDGSLIILPIHKKTDKQNIIIIMGCHCFQFQENPSLKVKSIQV
jgi:hypothetical protein